MAHRASGARPDQPAVHPDIVVVVPHHALTDDEPDAFDPPQLVGAGPLTLQDVYRLALLGTVSTMTVDACGRLASHDQWIALRARRPPAILPANRGGGHRHRPTGPWPRANLSCSGTGW